MAGSTFGTNFKIMTWGESHGKALGVVIDGCPAGLFLCEDDIQKYLDRRKPGKSKYATPRKEGDAVTILSGVFEGKTTGTPISLMVENTSQKSADYSEIASFYRPGHADFTFDEKYGFRDYRGGGRSSGRESIGRVAAGAVAAKLLESLSVHILAYTKSIGPVSINESHFQKELIYESALAMPDAEASKQAEAYLNACMQEYNSAGGIIECKITGVPAGIGEPVFEKLDAKLSHAIMSIGAVKAFEIGDGFAVSKSSGLSNNDPFVMENGQVKKLTNHAGGILGGISDGSEILFRAAIKPTPSVYSEQKTVNKNGDEISVHIKGRHDPIIVPRAVVVVEAMAALTVADLMLANMHSRVDYIQNFYKQ